MIKQSNFKGLTTKEVEIRKEKGLVNKTEEKIIKSNWEIISENAFTLFNLFNFIIAMALFLVNAYTNMFFILIIFINICIGIIQEIHARNMVEELTIVAASKVLVIRDDKEIEILTEDIVLDDIVILEHGNQIGADSYVVEGEVEVNESLLTGESDNILKKQGDFLLSGSYVVSGKCYAKVEKVGAETFASQITSKVKKHKKVNSELLNAMRKVTKVTSFFIIPIGILLFIQAYYFREELLNTSVISTAAGLLGMLPKGLVLLISISVATGVIKLSRKRVLIQEMYSIETLAHIDVLCLDKTGTITEGKMRVSNVHILKDTFMPITVEEAIASFAQKMEDNNATFLALKEYFNKESSLELITKVPFSSERKWSSATFKDIGSIVLGAPEKLLDTSDFTLSDEIVKAQKSGKRILLVGYTKETVTNKELPSLTIIAVIELDDPLKKNAKEMLGFFKNEGVEVKIISGDNVLTVSSIAKKAGLDNYESYIDMSTIRNEEIQELVNRYSIFARVSPEQKSLIVKALQKNGHTVAMTGDGVNDVIALRDADCSITMSNGSDVAKQVSQVVLLDSDFGVLKDVLMEGRRVVNNITNVARLFFIKTIYSVLLSILCIVTNIPFPFIPIQITLIDLVIEAYTSLFITFEPNKERIKDSFLKSVLTNATPYALTIIISMIIINIVVPIFTISNIEVTTIKYYMIGFISILAVIKICQPFNKLRIFLCTTTAVGFYVATLLFRELLHLEVLSNKGLLLFFVLAIIGVFIRKILAEVITKIRYYNN